jgi:hypothetical protein
MTPLLDPPPPDGVRIVEVACKIGIHDMRDPILDQPFDRRATRRVTSAARRKP